MLRLVECSRVDTWDFRAFDTFRDFHTKIHITEKSSIVIYNVTLEVLFILWHELVGGPFIHVKEELFDWCNVAKSVFVSRVMGLTFTNFCEDIATAEAKLRHAIKFLNSTMYVNFLASPGEWILKACKTSLILREKQRYYGSTSRK